MSGQPTESQPRRAARKLRSLVRQDIRTGLQLWRFARDNGLQAVADRLRKYVRDGQPDGFCKGYTTRAMCRIASKGVEGVRDDEDDRSYIDTKHGGDLYFYMWGLDPLPNVKADPLHGRGKTQPEKQDAES